MTSRSRKSTIEQSEVILKTDDRRRVFQVPLLPGRDLDEALGGEREVPEDAEHVTMAPNTSRCRCEQTTSRIPKTSREPIGCQRSLQRTSFYR